MLSSDSDGIAMLGVLSDIMHLKRACHEKTKKVINVQLTLTL